MVSRPRRRMTAPRLTLTAALVVVAAGFVMPFLVALAGAFREVPDLVANPVQLWPGEGYSWTLDGLQRLRSGGVRIDRAALNSLVITVAVVAGRIVMAATAGYALSFTRFPGRRLVFGILVAVLAVPPIILAIPRFLVLKELDLLNSYGGIVIPLMFDAFGILLMKQYFDQVPRELTDAARVDGAGPLRTLWSVALPTAAPGLAAVTVLAAQGTWNEFLHPLIAAPTEAALRPLPVELALLRSTFGEAQPWNAMLAGAVIATVPIALVFVAFQRFFVQGLADSGMKD
jgi:multiple sugar transport system permease protein